MKLSLEKNRCIMGSNIYIISGRMRQMVNKRSNCGNLFTSMSQDIRQLHVYISAVFMSIYRIFATRTSDAVESGKLSLCRQARSFESNDNDKAKIYREITLESGLLSERPLCEPARCEPEVSHRRLNHPSAWSRSVEFFQMVWVLLKTMALRSDFLEGSWITFNRRAVLIRKER